jgi:transcriptional regulator with XRE-family HTH domain
MGNDRLRSTMRANSYTEASLAEELGVDAKTVQRWASQGRVPHRNTAVRAAKVLGVPAAWLWPDLDAADHGDVAEVVAFYPHRAQVPKTVWLDVLVAARERIDIVSYASLVLPEDNPEAIQLLRHKAESGAKVRIALGDPDSPEIALRDREEQMNGGISGRVRMALAYYGPLVGVPGVEFHLHRTTLYNTMLRFDDQLLVNQHVYGTYGYLAPILHLRRVDTGDLFTTYERSIERVWAESYPMPTS